MFTDADFQDLLLTSIQDELDAEASDAIAPTNDVKLLAAAERPSSPVYKSDAATPPMPRQHIEDTPTYQPLQQRNHTKRAIKRRKIIAAEGHKPKQRTLNDFVQLSDPHAAELDISSLRVANGGYSALREKLDQTAEREYTLHELTEDLGFDVIDWDGRQVNLIASVRLLICSLREPRPILDNGGRVIAVLAGQPSDRSYSKAADRAFKAMMQQGSAAGFGPNGTKHRRGAFPVLNVGVSYGKGQQEPAYLQTGAYTPMLNRLVEDKSFERLAAFASGEYSPFGSQRCAYTDLENLPAAFQLWAPNIYKYYDSHLKALYTQFPRLNRVFPGSIYPCAAFNFGGNVWTFKHRDILNCPFGWCAVTALGEFDAHLGGHLVLWELGLAIEFPHGSTILIPSATITHSNISVQAGDSRNSFTQFCAGGLFRYVDNGFRTERVLERQDRREFHRLKALKSKRWEEGLSLFSTIQDLMNT